MNNLPNSPKAALSRRKFLGTALAGTTATLAGAASTSFFSTEPAFAQSNLTPDEALKVLLDGNERSVSGRFGSFDEDLKILRDHTVDKQEPFAAVLSCADSRVPVNHLRPDHRTHLRSPCRRQRGDAGNHRQPRIRRRRPRYKGHPRSGPCRVRRSQGGYPGQGGSGTDQLSSRTFSPPSPRLETTCQPQLKPTQKSKLRYCRARLPCSHLWCRRRN